MSKGNDRVEFAYGVGNSRYQREDSRAGCYKRPRCIWAQPSVSLKTAALTSNAIWAGWRLRPGTPSTGVQQLAYLLKDHIGSIHTVLNESGAITASMHFSAFGQRQDADWQTPLTSFLYAPLNDITTRGFTGHEQVDSIGIVHMNGRIYDPKLGRMLQADPVVQAPKNSQSLNRYSYVFNNPLSYTDPSGYFIEGFMKATGGWAIHKFFNRVPFLNVAVSVVLNVVPGCQVWCSALWNANSNYVATGSLSSAFKSGAITAATSYAMGEIANSPSLGATQKLVGTAIVGGISAELQGGKFGHGFLAAGVGYQMGTVTGGPGPVTPGKLLAVMIVGGTVSEITGGKFANGAFSAGFAYVIAASARADGEAPYLGDDNSDIAIVANSFNNGDKLADALQAKISSVVPELIEALGQMTLEYAPDVQVNLIAKRFGIPSSQVRAYARGSTMFIPRGQSVSLGLLAHEAFHVYQFQTIPNYSKLYDKALERYIKSGYKPMVAYRNIPYERQAFRIQKRVVEAYEN